MWGGFWRPNSVHGKGRLVWWPMPIVPVLLITTVALWYNMSPGDGNLSIIVLIFGLVMTVLFAWGALAAHLVKIKSDELHAATSLLRQLRQALDGSAIVSMTDVRGIITYANDNFCRVSGYSREELLGHNHRIIKSGLHPREYYADMWRTIAGGRVWTGEFCNRNKHGDRYWVFSTIFPILGKDGQVESYMGIRHDISDRKKAEAVLAAQAAELQRSNAALETLDHVMAHELKTPLTVIKMAAENLTDLDLGPLNKSQGEMVGMIDKNVDYMSTTINGLLRMAIKHGDGDDLGVRDLDIRRHIDKVVANLRGLAQERNVGIRDAVSADLPDIECSPGVFAEVLTNLIGNAIRYAAHEVVVESRLLPGKVQFGVCNDGPCIPEAQLSGLFEKFASDNKEQSPLFKGSGLGLYICKDLVSQMGGEIWAESEDGKGACFYFTLTIGDKG